MNNLRKLVQNACPKKAVGVMLLAAATLCLAPTGARSQSLTVPAQGEIPVAFVLGKDAEVLDFTGPLEVFAHAQTSDGRPMFKPYFVAAGRDAVRVSGGLRVVPDHTFADAPAPKVVVIPALSEPPPAMIAWIRRVSGATDVTMSVCTGAFVLAETGLLDGKPATTHHAAYFRFAGTYPKVQLREGARYVETGNLATAGGVTSGIDLALRVVERYAGHEQAQAVADILEHQGQGWLHPDSNQAYASPPPSTDQNPVCPLCGMPADRTIRSDFQGRTFYFCSKDEKSFFDEHPEVAKKILAKDAAYLTKPANAD